MHARRISEEVTKMIIFLQIYLTAVLFFIPIVIIFALLKTSTLGNKPIMFWIDDILIYIFWLLVAIGMVIGVVGGLYAIWSGAIV